MCEYKKKDYYFIDNNKIVNLSQFRKSPLCHDVISNIASFSFDVLKGEPNKIIKQPYIRRPKYINVFFPQAILGSSFRVVNIPSGISNEEDNNQLQINLAWDNALKAIKEEDYERAAKAFSKAIELGDKSSEVYSNWGATIGDLAYRKEGAESNELFVEECEKLKKAIEIQSDFCDAYYNWGVTLVMWASKSKGEERNKLIKDAIVVLTEAEKVKRGTGAYYLAFIYGLNDENECQKWLKIGEEEKMLPERQEAMANSAFVKVRDKQWFKDIHWKGE